MGRALHSFLSLFASLKLAIGLILATAIFLAVATAYESRYGTHAARQMFYTSRSFTILLALLAMSVLAAVVVRYPWKRKHTGFIITHCGIEILLAGCLISFHRSIDGRMVLRQGESAGAIRVIDEATDAPRQELPFFALPFSIKLLEARKTLDPGTDVAAELLSIVETTDAKGRTRRHEIALNQPMTIDGFRFYQSGIEFVDGATLSVLSVRRDPGGVVKYVGCGLIVAGIFTMFYMRAYLAKPQAAGEASLEAADLPVPVVV